MNKILLFATESQFSKEIIQFLLAKNYFVHVFSFKPFKDNKFYSCKNPLQMQFSVVNISNYYNWYHEVVKYDCAINTLTYANFAHIQNHSYAFVNFVHNLAKTTYKHSIKFIHTSSVSNPKIVQDSELSMLKINPNIFNIKYSFVIERQSSFLKSLFACKFVFLSKKLLETKLNISPIQDINSCINNILQNQYLNHKTVIFSETFTLKDIHKISTKTHSFVLKVPHFLLIIKWHIARFLMPCYLKQIMAYKKEPKPQETNDYTQYPKHTLLSSIIEFQTKNPSVFD